MKNTFKFLLSLILVLACIFMCVACSGPVENPKTNGEETTNSESGSIASTGLWENATYTSDTEFGSGAKTVVVEVKVEEQTVRFTIKTDKDTVGAALLEHGLIEGEEGQYGLYVKVVNGIRADYDKDKRYWAFYIDGEYAMTGIELTEITDGAKYQLEYAK